MLFKTELSSEEPFTVFCLSHYLISDATELSVIAAINSPLDDFPLTYGLDGAVATITETCL